MTILISSPAERWTVDTALLVHHSGTACLRLCSHHRPPFDQSSHLCGSISNACVIARPSELPDLCCVLQVGGACCVVVGDGRSICAHEVKSIRKRRE